MTSSCPNCGETVTQDFCASWGQAAGERYELVFTGFMAVFVTILTVYVVKVLFAAADTPLCYLAVWLTRRYSGAVEEIET